MAEGLIYKVVHPTATLIEMAYPKAAATLRRMPAAAYRVAQMVRHHYGSRRKSCLFSGAPMNGDLWPSP